MKLEQDNTSLPPFPVAFLDVTDFLKYAESGNVTVSGIQRVIANLVKNVHVSKKQVIFTSFDSERQSLLAIDMSAVNFLVECLLDGNAQQKKIPDIVRDIIKAGLLIQARPNDAVVLAGAFWIYSDFVIFARMRRRGVKIILFVHDLIQIDFPQYVSADANEKFLRSFLDIMSSVTLVLTNSDYVLHQVEQFLHTRLAVSLPVSTVKLPTELQKIPNKTAEIEDFVKVIAEKEFALCVSTIEIRKNHIYILKIWEKLRRIKGLSVPNLVWVGKWGWQIDDLREYIETIEDRHEWLFLLHNISDSSLQYLYEKSLLTVYPSFAEGWGLPVGESLSYGKPCFASNTTSIPEVGGALVQYFDPYDIKNGFNLFKNALKDRKLLKNLANNIRKNFKIRTWEEYSSEFYGKICAHIASETTYSRFGNYTYFPAFFYSLGNQGNAISSETTRNIITARTTALVGWSSVNNEGRWACNRNATLCLPTEFPAGTRVTVYATIKINRSIDCLDLTVRCGSNKERKNIVSHQSFSIKFQGEVSKENCINIYFSINNKKKIKEKNFFLISEIAFIESGNEKSRIDIIEDILLKNSTNDKKLGHQGNGNLEAHFLFRLAFQKRTGRSSNVLERVSDEICLYYARKSARQGLWASSEKWYAKILRRNLHREKILIQYGHALKEQNLYEEACYAYRLAKKLHSTDIELDNYIKSTEDHIEIMRRR